ncbi:MAG: hypothetical protein O7F16_09535, partial [Acidobacteria bacterium]|nr:hypothetical protein [Acidobacteriota bacterium]
GRIHDRLNHTLSTVPVQAIVNPPDQAPVSQGSSVTVDFTWFNPLPTATTANKEVVLVDPAGGRTILDPVIQVTVQSLQTVTQTGVSFTLPPVNPAHLGFPFSIELRFSDVITGAEFDRDKTKFVIQ